MNTPLLILPAPPGLPGTPAEVVPGIPRPTSDVTGDLFAQLRAGVDDAAITPWSDMLTARVNFSLAVGQGDGDVVPDETGVKLLTQRPTAIADFIQYTVPDVHIPDAPHGDPPHEQARPAKRISEATGNAQPKSPTPPFTGAASERAIEPVVHRAVTSDGEVLQGVRGQGLPVEPEIPRLAEKSPLSPSASKELNHDSSDAD